MCIKTALLMKWEIIPISQSLSISISPLPFLYHSFISHHLFVCLVSLCSPGWPGTLYLDQVSLELTEFCLPQQSRISKVHEFQLYSVLRARSHKFRQSHMSFSLYSAEGRVTLVQAIDSQEESLFLETSSKYYW